MEKSCRGDRMALFLCVCGRKISRQPFPYLCADGSRTSCLLWSYIALEAFLCFFVPLQCPPISDRLFANSRTLDIGKGCRLIFLVVD